jgi:membrane-bound lytic murein transglycosylase MltF
MQKRRVIRAILYPSRFQYFYDGAEPRGLVAESLREFESFLNKKLKTEEHPVVVVVLPVRGDDLVPALVEGRGDLIVAGMTITEERARQISFSSPLVDNLDKVVVTGPSSPPLTSVDDLSGKEIYYRTSHSFHQELLRLNERLTKAGKPPAILKPADENLQDDDIYEMVNAGLIPLTVGERRAAEVWAHIFKDLKVRADLAVKTGDKGAWAARKDSPKLLKLVNEFWSSRREGTAFGNTLLHRYLQNVRWVENARSSKEMQKYLRTVQFFRKYSQQYDLDYLLMAAQGYQESRLDQSLRSRVGAVGVMQIKPETAAGHPIRIQGVDASVEKNIHAGVKYVRYLMDDILKDEPMDRLNKGLFALASYNAGPARIQKLRAKAAEQGLDPNKWFENVELVAAKDIGRETVQYVANIYKYYITYRLIEDERQQHKAGSAAPPPGKAASN